jgi:hypothetical protein
MAAYFSAKNALASKPWPAVVDAVTSVVAEEIERPLQARIEALEEKLERDAFTIEHQRQLINQQAAAGMAPTVNDWPAFDSEWSVNMRAHLGKNVTVVLQDEPNRASITGTLLSFSEDGEVVVRAGDGTAHWCWPNLRTESARDTLQTRVEVLTAALTEIADEADPCTDERTARHFVDCPVCGARAVLAAGKEES